ncbi:CD225/dispanin family protein [Nocardiopsis composta]
MDLPRPSRTAPGGYGPPHGGQPMGERPEVGLAGVIFSLLCCWPLGIPALVFQMKIDNLWSQGDYQGAQEAADKAKKFRNIAFILGSISIVISIVLSVINMVIAASAVEDANQDLQELEQMQESYEDSYDTEDLDQLNEDLEQDLEELESY